MVTGFNDAGSLVLYYRLVVHSWKKVMDKRIILADAGSE
jgi:hypothetical protein